MAQCTVAFMATIFIGAANSDGSPYDGNAPQATTEQYGIKAGPHQVGRATNQTVDNGDNTCDPEDTNRRCTTTGASILANSNRWSEQCKQRAFQIRCLETSELVYRIA